MNLNEEYWELKDWFIQVYMPKEQKYRRLHTLKLLTDDGQSPYDKLIELYNEAEIKRARIQTLEAELNINQEIVNEI